MLGGLTIGTTEFVVMGLLPDIASDLKVSIPVAGYLISAYALGVVIGAPLIVMMARNAPPKKILMILAVMLTVFNSLAIIAPSYNFLFLSRLLAGLPHGAFFGVGAVVATRLAEKGKEGQAISIMFSGLTVANLAGVPFGTYIGHHFAWRYTFIIIAFIGLLTIAALYFWMPNLEARAKVTVKSQLQVFKKLDAWLVILITAIGTGGLFCWISYIAPLLTNVSKFSAENVSYILVLAGLGMVIGNLIGGKLTDRFSPEISIIAILLSLSVDLVLVYLFSSNQYASLILVFTTGCISFSIGSAIQILMIRTAVDSELIASASIQAAFNVGNALGAFLGGLPLVAGLNYATPNLVGVVMSICGALITVFFLQRKRKLARLQNI